MERAVQTSVERDGPAARPSGRRRGGWRTDVALPRWLLGELRSDHAGETGAVRIYQGVLAVAGHGELERFAREHMSTEQRHLVLIRRWLPKRHRSRLLPLWHAAGFLTGLLPALFGRQAVFATISTVETFVDAHYQRQVERIDRLLRDSDEDDGTEALRALREVIVRCHADEIAHRQDAERRIVPGRPPLVLRLWCDAVARGSAIAASLARRC